MTSGKFGAVGQNTMSKSRSWVFTINNPTDEDDQHLADLHGNCRYICYAPEEGEQGTAHYQGYVVFTSPKTMRAVSRLLPRAYLAPAKGNAAQNVQYIQGPYIGSDGKTKPLNPGFVSCGDMPAQGKRSDIEEVKDLVKQGKPMREIVPVCTSYQSLKFAESIQRYFEPVRDWKPHVEWFYGPTGTGKTRKAYEELGGAVETYTAMSTGRWWEGYDQHENVLIDDMRKDFMKFHELLRLLDRYPMKVETKGGSRQFVAKKIIITSCYSPRELFEVREDVGQLLRRIDRTVHFSSEFSLFETDLLHDHVVTHNDG